MKTLLVSILSTIVLAGTAIAQSGGVAILDIDEVARALGVNDEVRVKILTLNNQLSEDLAKTQASLQNQMSGVEQAAGDNPSEEQRRQLLATNQQLNAEFNRLKAQAQQTLTQERSRLIAEFRIQIEPIALEAAKEKGLDVVLTKVSPPVFTYTNQVDITQMTIDKAVEAGMKVDPPAEPEAATPSATPVTEDASKGKAKEKGGE